MLCIHPSPLLILELRWGRSSIDQIEISLQNLLLIHLNRWACYLFSWAIKKNFKRILRTRIKPSKLFCSEHVVSYRRVHFGWCWAECQYTEIIHKLLMIMRVVERKYSLTLSYLSACCVQQVISSLGVRLLLKELTKSSNILPGLLPRITNDKCLWRDTVYQLECFVRFLLRIQVFPLLIFGKENWLMWHLELQAGTSLETIGFIYLMISWFILISLYTKFFIWTFSVTICTCEYIKLNSFIPISIMSMCTSLFWRIPKWCCIPWSIREWFCPEGWNWAVLNAGRLRKDQEAGSTWKCLCCFSSYTLSSTSPLRSPSPPHSGCLRGVALASRQPPSLLYATVMMSCTVFLRSSSSSLQLTAIASLRSESPAP